MKKLVLTSVCALAMVGAAFAQGTLNWGAISPGAFTAQTNATVTSPLFGPNTAIGGTIGATASAAHGFYYELLYNTAFTGSQASSPTYGALFVGGTWLDAGLSATNTVSSTGKATPIAPSTGATVPWANLTTNNIVIVGWSGNLGTSWSTVSGELANWATVQGNFAGNSFFGVSTTGYINPGTVNPGPGPVGTVPISAGLPIFSLNTQLYLLPTTIPEPTTLVLAGLGGLSLLLFRRRK